MRAKFRQVRRQFLGVQCEEVSDPVAVRRQLRKVGKVFFAVLMANETDLSRMLLCRAGRKKTLKEPKYEELEKSIFALELSGDVKKQRFQLLSFFYNWVLAGNEIGVWKLELPALPFYVPSPISPYTGEKAEWSRSVAKLEVLLKHSLVKTPSLSGEGLARYSAGQFLLCLITHGAIHNLQSLRSLCRTRELKTSGKHVWIEIRFQTDKQPEPERRRWFPDPLSEILCLRMSKEAAVLLRKVADQSSFPARAINLIKSFLREIDVGVAKTLPALTTLLAQANYRLALRSSHIIAAYAKRDFITHSLGTDAWGRLMGCPVPLDVEGDDRQIEDKLQTREVRNRSEYIDTPVSVQPAAPSYSKELRQLRKELMTGTLAETDEQSTNTGQATELITSWIREWHHKGPPYGKKPVAKTLAGYVSSMGQRLVAAAGQANLLDLEEKEFEDLYWSIIEDAETSSLKQTISKALGEFHRYLRINYEDQVPVLKNSRALGIGTSQAAVDANLLSIEEYEACIRQLGTDRDIIRQAYGLCEIAILILTIGFKCGTRRSEVLKLRLNDLHMDKRPELLIRKWSERGLKTNASHRKVPLYALLNSDELARLKAFWQKRRKQSAGLSGDHYLFALPEIGMHTINEESIFGHIHRVMRRVTGDETIRFHHLRHSAGSWIFLRLFLSEFDATLALFPALPETQEWLNHSKELREALNIPIGPTRKYAYAVASLLGHSGPDMSFEHYVHFFDIVSKSKRPTLLKFDTLADYALVPTSTRYLMAPGNKHKSATRSDLEKTKMLLEWLRARPENKGQYRHLSPGEPPQTDDLPGSVILKRMDAFHAAVRQPHTLDAIVVNDFGFQPKQGAAYISKINEIRHLLQRNYGRRSPVSPVGPMNESEKALLWSAADKAFEFWKRDRTKLDRLAQNLKSIRWASKNGFRFDLHGQVQLAKDFLALLEPLGLGEEPVFFFFVKDAKEKVISRWRELLDVDDCSIGAPLPRLREDSPAVLRSCVIKVSRLEDRKKQPNAEVGVLKALLHLHAIYLAGET